jgi:predicted dehydrogenase
MWGTLSIAPNPMDPGTLVKSEVKTLRGDYRGFYANVRDAINGMAEQAVKAVDGLHVIKLLEMARVSSAEGRTLRVEF